MSEEELAEAEAMYAQQVRLQWKPRRSILHRACTRRSCATLTAVSYTSAGFMGNLSAGS